MPLLKIDIEARYAQFQDALNAIQRDTKKAAGNMSRDFESVKGVLAGVGSVVSVGVITAVIKNAIDAADSLRDLSQQTGIAVENLGGLGFAAGQAGGDLDSIAEAAGRLNKSLAGAARGEKEFIEGFKAIGIEITDAAGKLKKADKVFVEIASKFEKYADGPEKVAIATRLFGKSGADMISFLNEGGAAIQANIDFYKRFSGATEDLSDKADEFNDAMGKLKLISNSVGNSMAREVLPILNLVSQEMIDSADGADKFSLAGATLRTLLETLVIAGSDIAHTFRMVGDEIGGTAARLALLGKGEFKLAWDMGDIMDADQQAALKRLEEFQKKVLDRSSGFKPATAKNGGKPNDDKPDNDKPPMPGLPKKGSAVSARMTDGRLRELERMSDDEQRLLASRSDFLQSYYSKDLLAISDYYDGLRAYQDEALKSQKEIIQKEIDLVRGSSPKDAQEAAGNKSKVSDLMARMATLESEAARAGAKLLLEQDSAAKAYASTLKSINAELLEQQGLLPEAAALRFDQANSQVTQRINVQRDSAIGRDDTAGVAEADAALAKLESMRGLIVAQARLNTLGDIGARVQGTLAEATERAQIASQQGNVTELEGSRLVSDARLQAVADLQQVASAYEVVARSSGDPRIIQQARALQLEIDKLAASADLVRDKFADAFSGPFESALDKLIDGTASFKDAIKGLLSDVAREMTKMATQDFTKQLFSEKGKLGGLVDSAAAFFGGKSGASNVTPTASVGSAVATAVGGSTDAVATAAASTAMTTLATSTAAADGALLALGITVPAADSFLSGLGGTALIANTFVDGLAASALRASIALDAAAASAGGKAGGEAAAGIFGALVAAKNGHVFSDGNVVPFAKGGMPDIVSAPMYFPMKDGRTGLMGEAGPEAIMPLTRGRDGLSITAIDERGKAALLPVMRDATGKMAVRQPQAFATGGVFSGGALMAAANTVQGPRAEMMQQVSSGNGDGKTVVNNHFTINGPTNPASQSQIAAAAARGVAQGKRNL